MPRKRKAETDVERTHEHCADELMRDFGIPKEMRVKVCDEVAKVGVQVTMIHSSIYSFSKEKRESSEWVPTIFTG